MAKAFGMASAVPLSDTQLRTTASSLHPPQRPSACTPSPPTSSESAGLLPEVTARGHSTTVAADVARLFRYDRSGLNVRDRGASCSFSPKTSPCGSYGELSRRNEMSPQARRLMDLNRITAVRARRAMREKLAAHERAGRMEEGRAIASPPSRKRCREASIPTAPDPGTTPHKRIRTKGGAEIGCHPPKARSRPPTNSVTRGVSHAKRQKPVTATPLFGIPHTVTSPFFPLAGERRRKLCFIDVGINNLGLVFFSGDSRWVLPSVDSVALVDLMALDRSLVPTYAHSNETCDRLERFFVSMARELEECDAVFIERQPLVGFKAIEQLIFARFRSKAVLLCPNSIHAHFRMSLRHGYDRAGRKRLAVRIAESYLEVHGSDDAKRVWNSLDRQHDVADAILLGIYVFERKRWEWRETFDYIRVGDV